MDLGFSDGLILGTAGELTANAEEGLKGALDRMEGFLEKGGDPEAIKKELIAFMRMAVGLSKGALTMFDLAKGLNDQGDLNEILTQSRNLVAAGEQLSQRIMGLKR